MTCSCKLRQCVRKADCVFSRNACGQSKKRRWEVARQCRDIQHLAAPFCWMCSPWEKQGESKLHLRVLATYRNPTPQPYKHWDFFAARTTEIQRKIPERDLACCYVWAAGSLPALTVLLPETSYSQGISMGFISAFPVLHFLADTEHALGLTRNPDPESVSGQWGALQVPKVVPLWKDICQSLSNWDCSMKGRDNLI